jgi:hypothetical protein
VSGNFSLAEVEHELHRLADAEKAQFLQRFFKTAPGQYAEGDRFLGIRVPQLRALVRRYRLLPHEQVLKLLASPWHEQRLLALLLLVEQYRHGTDAERERRSTARTSITLDTSIIGTWSMAPPSTLLALM